ncbi:MAG TPA: hypothetical protein VF597_04225 [Candidatus Saccharimonadales bacterium]|jgi:hypothetical protein
MPKSRREPTFSQPLSRREILQRMKLREGRFDPRTRREIKLATAAIPRRGRR